MAVLLRAIVMLAILVGLPAAWVYYGPLPPRAQGVVDRIVVVARETLGWEQPTAVESDMVAAPLFDPAVTPAVAIRAVSTPQPVAEVATSRVRQSAPAAAARTLQEKLAPLLEQLRARGATEYALEKWGADGQLYRFRCSMSLANGDQVTQQFEAVHLEPSDSIQQVLAEVAHWQSARVDRPQFK